MRSILTAASVLVLVLPVFSGCSAQVESESIDQVMQQVVPPPPPPPAGCTGGLVTRTQGFWQNHSCVVKGDATGFSLVPLMLGAGLLIEKPADADAYLDQPTRGDKQIILGHQLLAAKLNVAAFQIGEIEFADWDGDGANETVSELLAIADVLFDSGVSCDQEKMATILDKLNNEGDGEDLWFDPTCRNPPTPCH